MEVHSVKIAVNPSENIIAVKNTNDNTSRILLLDLNGNQIDIIFPLLTSSFSELSKYDAIGWSYDGQEILFIADWSGVDQLWSFNISLRAFSQITGSVNQGIPVSQLLDYSRLSHQVLINSYRTGQWFHTITW